MIAIPSLIVASHFLSFYTALKNARSPSTYNINNNIYISPSSPFFQKLGLTDSNGIPLAEGKGDEQRQHNQWLTSPGYALKRCIRFTDIVGDVIDRYAVDYESKDCDGLRLRTIDVGCGRIPYLTFSLHAYLFNKYLKTTTSSASAIESHPKVISVQTQGIDRDIAADKLNLMASELGHEFESLKFIQGSMGKKQRNLGNKLSFDVDGSSNSNSTEGGISTLDVLIATHLCDTATDDAIWYGISQNADIMVLTPCCQNELTSQYSWKESFSKRQQRDYKDRAYLSEVWKNEPTLVTDSIRAMLLEMAGYDIEILSEGDISRSAMFTAVKRRGVKDDKAGLMFNDQQYAASASFASVYGVESHRLAKLMGVSLRITH